MDFNYVEDALIREIDGKREEQDSVERALDRGSLNYCFRSLDDAIDSAGKYPGASDAALTVRLASLSYLENKSKTKLETLVRETGLSRRKLRALSVTDQRRIAFELLDTTIRDLTRRRETTENCLVSRWFLKEQTTLIRLYLESKGRGTRHHEFSISKLKAMYPDV